MKIHVLNQSGGAVEIFDLYAVDPQNLVKLEGRKRFYIPGPDVKIINSLEFSKARAKTMEGQQKICVNMKGQPIPVPNLEIEPSKLEEYHETELRLFVEAGSNPPRLQYEISEKKTENSSKSTGVTSLLPSCLRGPTLN